MGELKIAIISDLHQKIRVIDNIPENVDLVLCAGDFSSRFVDPRQCIEWSAQCLSDISAPTIVISGNHDSYLETNPEQGAKIFENYGLTYLQDQTINILGLKIHGSPWSVLHDGGWHFEKYDDELEAIWEKIPNDIDILLTHTPPYKILDGIAPQHWGSKSLARRIYRFDNLILHAFGHIHESRGSKEEAGCNTTFINAAIDPREDGHQPILVDLHQDDSKWKVKLVA
tara:strand:+ start:260 stop:943 length:684 start_codon:yes stop_codon:yes gene_type:complete